MPNKNERMALYTNKNGARFKIALDEKGRPFIIAPDGNLYYDSGVDEVGFYRVSP